MPHKDEQLNERVSLLSHWSRRRSGSRKGMASLTAVVGYTTEICNRCYSGAATGLIVADIPHIRDAEKDAGLSRKSTNTSRELKMPRKNCSNLVRNSENVTSVLGAVVFEFNKKTSSIVQLPKLRC